MTIKLLFVNTEIYPITITLQLTHATPIDESTKTTSITRSGLKIVHLNIRSLRNTAHIVQLRYLAISSNIDVLTISETWLSTTCTNSEVGIASYNLFRLDRLHKRGGGVCAHVRKELKASVLKELSEISETDFHQLWIKVQCKMFKSLLICVPYRPPDCPVVCFESFFKPNYIQALQYGKPIFILGDLNCNLLKTSQEQKALNDVSTELNLTQIINNPTRITNTCHSLI